MSYWPHEWQSVYSYEYIGSVRYASLARMQTLSSSQHVIGEGLLIAHSQLFDQSEAIPRPAEPF